MVQVTCLGLFGGQQSMFGAFHTPANTHGLFAFHVLIAKPQETTAAAVAVATVVASTRVFLTSGDLGFRVVATRGACNDGAFTRQRRLLVPDRTRGHGAPGAGRVELIVRSLHVRGDHGKKIGIVHAGHGERLEQGVALSAFQ
jgi:hypothetical protein